MEILTEPLKVPDEPLLKTEEKAESPTAPPPSPPPAEKVEEPPVKTEEKPPTTSETITEKPQENLSEKSSPEIKLETVSTDNESETEDDVEELYLKKKNNKSQSGKNANTLAPHGSTTSLDKDKISIDSLDISNDRRQISNSNNH